MYRSEARIANDIQKPFGDDSGKDLGVPANLHLKFIDASQEIHAVFIPLQPYDRDVMNATQSIGG